MELALIRSLMDREFYKDHRGARCPNRLFSKDVRKIKEVIDNAMTRYDRTVTPDEIEALFMSNNPSMTTAQKGAYSSLFLKIKKEQKLGEDIAKEVLSKYNITYNTLLEEIKKFRKGNKAMNNNAESGFDTLNRFAENLTIKASKGQLDPVIGRDEEIRRLIQVLSRRTKNNPVLIGEPGVGKTAVVEGLAIRIGNDDVPEKLKGKEIFSLDLASILAGAKFRGDFEERIKSLLIEIEKQKNKIILFIDGRYPLIKASLVSFQVASLSLRSAPDVKPLPSPISTKTLISESFLTISVASFRSIIC